MPIFTIADTNDDDVDDDDDDDDDSNAAQGIRIPSPSHDQIAEVLLSVAKKEQTPCSLEFALKISAHSERNLRRALLMLEASKLQTTTGAPLNDVVVQLPDWEVYVVRLAREILQVRLFDNHLLPLASYLVFFVRPTGCLYTACRLLDFC